MGVVEKADDESAAIKSRRNLSLKRERVRKSRPFYLRKAVKNFNFLYLKSGITQSMLYCLKEKKFGETEFGLAICTFSGNNFTCKKKSTMDLSVTNSTPLTFSEELKLAIKERNVLTTKSKMKVLSALNDLTKATAEEKRAEFRKKVISEIYTTEKTYLHQLEVIMKFFMEPLQRKAWLPHSTFNTLFGNIEILHKVNGELLKALNEGESHVANAFCKMAPYLKLYSVYAYDYKKALQILQTMVKTNKELNKFIISQETRPEVATSLQSLLIVPIQRIPRYKLLLQELLNYTVKDDSSYYLIKDALSKVEKTAEHINELVTEYENAEQMLLLARRVVHSPVDIVVPGRKIIKQGCLMKATKSGRTSNQRYLILFNDSLMYCKGKEEGTLKFSCLLPLKHCQVEPVFGTGVFKINCQGEVILLYTADPVLGQEWISALQAAMKDYQVCRWTLRKESSKRKPIRRREILRSDKRTLHQSDDSKVSTFCFRILRRIR